MCITHRYVHYIVQIPHYTPPSHDAINASCVATFYWQHLRLMYADLFISAIIIIAEQGKRVVRHAPMTMKHRVAWTWQETFQWPFELSWVSQPALQVVSCMTVVKQFSNALCGQASRPVFTLCNLALAHAHHSLLVCNQAPINFRPLSKSCWVLT